MIQFFIIHGVAEMLARKCAYREIQSKYPVGSGSITKIKRFCESQNLSLEDLGRMTGEEIEELFNPKVKRRSENKMLPDFESMYERLTAAQARTNLSVEWENYIKAVPPGSGYQYSQFCAHFNEWLKSSKGVKNLKMAINRIPGEYLYMDWCGDKISVVQNMETGEMMEAHFFVTTMGVSSLIFAKAYPCEKEFHVIDGINSALEYYGGLPRYLRPDNMRTAVIRNDREGVKLNSIMQDLQDFYGIPVRPARPYKPTDYRKLQNIGNFYTDRPYL